MKGQGSFLQHNHIQPHFLTQTLSTVRFLRWARLCATDAGVLICATAVHAGEENIYPLCRSHGICRHGAHVHTRIHQTMLFCSTETRLVCGHLFFHAWEDKHGSKDTSLFWKFWFGVSPVAYWWLPVQVSTVQLFERYSHSYVRVILTLACSRGKYSAL